ncbi:hypothetical protein V6N13_042382 [Hibiscus sabdariffa]
MHCFIFALNQLREMEMADEMVMSMRTNAETKEPINDPEVLSQKESNCWQIGDQFAFEFPSCAKYTIEAAAEAPAVTKASIACHKN